MPPILHDHQILGGKTEYLTIRADPLDTREWLAKGRVCQLLDLHHISHVGIMRARPPFEVLRTNQNGTFMLACLEGEGVILSDGRWRTIKAGQACLLPPFVLNSLKCLGGKPWNFTWVRYRESRASTPIVSSASPVAGAFDGHALKAAVEGLHAEVGSGGGATAFHHWTELIHHYVLRFARPHVPDDRLWRMWQVAESDLKHPWTLKELAALACVSDEHLRRLCRKEIGRSPRQQLTFLRLQKAMHLLSTTDDKVEVIAREVGFESAFTFSNTFKQWIGWRPSDHRKRIL
jgi:AraC-like DNA-binding protein